MDSSKYDRQIRLFGLETQKKLINLKVQVLGLQNAVSMEIIKNIVLLGIGTVVINKKMIEEIQKYIPNSLLEINENLKIEFSETVVESDFLFLVDLEIENLSKNYYFVCSMCYTVKWSSSHSHCENDRNNKNDKNDLEKFSPELILAKQCLIGAVSVQEFLKLVQGKRYSEEFQFE